MCQDETASSETVPLFSMKTFLARSWSLLLGTTLLLPHPAATAAPGKPEWEVVRSIPREGGNLTHYVLIPASKQRDKGYYRRVANKVCGSADKAFVFFWTDRAHVPDSEWMPVRDMRAMTAEYERHPNYKQPSLHLAAWLYPTKEAGKKDHCFFAP